MFDSFVSDLVDSFRNTLRPVNENGETDHEAVTISEFEDTVEAIGKVLVKHGKISSGEEFSVACGMVYDKT